MLRLPVAPDHRRALLLGDHRLAPDRPWAGQRDNAIVARLGAMPGWRVACVAEPRSTAAAVRYVQVPRFLEMDFAPDLVVLAVGGADLEPAGVDPKLLDTALEGLAGHVDAAWERVIARAPGVPGVLSGIDPSDPGPWPLPGAWVDRVNAVLEGVATRRDLAWAGPEESLAYVVERMAGGMGWG